MHVQQLYLRTLQIPEVQTAMTKLITGLRILEGRCVNATEAAFMKVQPGSRPLHEEDINEAEKLILEGLAMLEGMYLL